MSKKFYFIIESYNFFSFLFFSSIIIICLKHKKENRRLYYNYFCLNNFGITYFVSFFIKIFVIICCYSFLLKFT